MWQHSVPSNQTILIHHNNSQDGDSPSDLLELPLEETLESQEEYPWEVAEEAEEVQEEAEGPQHQELATLETNSLVTPCLSSQGIEQNPKNL